MGYVLAQVKKPLIIQGVRCEAKTVFLNTLLRRSYSVQTLCVDEVPKTLYNKTTNKKKIWVATYRKKGFIL